MPKTKSKAPAERRGRPPGPDPMSKRALVRFSQRDHEAFGAEGARLTKVTGVQWTISGYLRFAGLQYIGKHLAER